MEYIEEYIRGQLSDKIISELKREINGLRLNDDDRYDVINLLEQSFQKIDWNFNEDFIKRLTQLKNGIQKNYTLLIIEAIYSLYHEEYEHVRMLMDNLVDVTYGHLNNYLRQFYAYIRLSHFPKKSSDDILADFNELLKYYVPVSIMYTTLLWEINNTLPNNYPFDKYDALCRVAIKKNPRELELYGYYFYILNHFKKWKQVIELADYYFEKFPYSMDINTVCFTKAQALHHLNQFHKSLKWYHNCILNTIVSDAENGILKAMSETGKGICYVKIARQRNYNIDKSFSLIEYYKKANKLFKSALTKIDCDEELDDYHLMTSLVLDAFSYPS